MIKKLTPDKITDKCSNYLIDMTPCPAINEISFNDIYLGNSTLRLFRRGRLLISAKSSGLTIELFDPMITSTLNVSKMGGDIKVRLASDGSSSTTTEKELYDELSLSMAGFLNLSLLGDGNDLVSTISKTKLAHSPREEKLKDSIPMFTCSICNGYLTYFRSWEIVAEDHSSYKNRAAINFISKELKRLGHVHPSLKSFYATEVNDPSVILPYYPSGDGTL